jgi:hypothetical protein
MRFHAHIKDKEIVFPNPAFVRVFLSKFEGKKVTVEVEKVSSKRSLQQNAWMWACFEVIGDYMGENKNTVHRIMTGLFAPKKEVKMGNRRMMIPKGTSEMSIGEMVQFMMEVSAEAGQFGITLPDPSLYADAPLK